MNGSAPELWTHIAFTAIFFVTGLVILRNFIQHLRHEMLPKREGRKDMLMISGIPKSLNTKKNLSEHFAEIYPDSPVQMIQPAYNISGLIKLTPLYLQAQQARIFFEASEHPEQDTMYPRYCSVFMFDHILLITVIPLSSFG